MWMAEWELPVAAVLAKDLDFDQTTPLCLGPALWEWQPWAKESWCDPRWIIQLLQAQSLAAFEGPKSLLRGTEEPACGANWAQVQGQLLVPLLLVLSLLNSVPKSNSQWMKRNQRGKVSGWDPGWCWAVAWQIQPQGTDTKPVVFAHLLVMVFNAAPCPSNISSAQKDGPDLIGSKNLLGYVLHKGKRARPSVLPAHGWLCE